MCSFFFFQAEDGIRDLVRSRGLGDVYKRQDFIILVVTKGDIEWDRAKNQWDFNITNVLPQSLRNIFKHEPIYADLRPLHDLSLIHI